MSVLAAFSACISCRIISFSRIVVIAIFLVSIITFTAAVGTCIGRIINELFVVIDVFEEIIIFIYRVGCTRSFLRLLAASLLTRFRITVERGISVHVSRTHVRLVSRL